MPFLTVPNLLAWSAQVALLIAAALMSLRLLRLDVPAVRYSVLRVLLLAVMLLPLAQPYRAATAHRGKVAAEAAFTPAAGAVFVTPGDGVDRVAAWQPAAAVLLIGGTLGRLLWLCAGIVRLRRLRRAGEAAATGEHVELQTSIGVRAAVRYVAALGQPVTFGARRPCVLLPAALRDQPPAIQRAVIAHELWHVRRRDWTWTVVEEAIRAVYWFHPCVWLLISRIQAAREEVVDDLAILTTGSRRSYVEALLIYSGSPAVFTATAFARRRALLRRLTLISKEAVMSARQVVGRCAVAAAVVVWAGSYGLQAFPLIHGQDASGLLSAEPGPVERAARPITPENPIPRRTFHILPDYPAEAEAVGAQGKVTVRLIVDNTGEVAEARVTGLSVKLTDGWAISADAMDPDRLERVIAGARTPAGQPGDRTAITAALSGMANAAVSSVRRWTYAAPLDGPLAFNVDVWFGMPPPPPPAPASAGGTVSGAPADLQPRTSPRPGTLPPPPPPPPAPRTAAATERTDGALRVGGGIKPPAKITHVNPVYPPEAKAEQIHGVVIIEARIERDGTVSQTRVLRSIPLLDGAAVDAVRQWEFTPTHLNGAPVPVLMTVTVNFTLQ